LLISPSKKMWTKPKAEDVGFSHEAGEILQLLEEPL
jgi:hypothetical protein